MLKKKSTNQNKDHTESVRNTSTKDKTKQDKMDSEAERRERHNQYIAELREQDRWLPINNVARLMKNTLPVTAKVSKDAKECMQECVSEFISFVTSEASDRCAADRRKTINGEDILISLHALGFENYAEVLKIYLAKYRQQQALKNQMMYSKREGDGEEEEEVVQQEQNEQREIQEELHSQGSPQDQSPDQWGNVTQQRPQPNLSTQEKQSQKEELLLEKQAKGQNAEETSGLLALDDENVKNSAAEYINEDGNLYM